MRVTHRMVADKINNNLHSNLRRLEHFAHQLSSGKVFTRPAENPVGVGRVMGYTAAISRNEQYMKNMNESRGWLETTEMALNEGINILQRLRELCVYGANDSLTLDERQTLACEVEELQEHLLGIANTEINGLYIFGGHRTLEAPYSVDQDGRVQYSGDSGLRKHEISFHQEVIVNLNGHEAFGTVELFETAQAIHQALLDGDSNFLSGEALDRLDRGINRLLEGLSQVGARVNRLNLMENTLFSENLHLREVRSKIEDIDLAYTITEYTMQENAYRAALATASRILQPSLVDYMC